MKGRRMDEEGLDREDIRFVTAEDLAVQVVLDEHDNVVMPDSFVWVADIRSKDTGGACQLLIAREGDGGMREMDLFCRSWEDAKRACGTANAENWTEDDVVRIVMSVHGGGSA